MNEPQARPQHRNGQCTLCQSTISDCLCPPNTDDQVTSLGELNCADCGGKHNIVAGPGGLLGTMEHCPATNQDTRVDGHVAMKCPDQKDGKPAHYDDGRHCPYCEDEIFACTLCKGLEGSLPTICPLRPINEEDQQRIYTGLLDFKGGQWIVREYEPLEEHDKNKETEAKEAADRLNSVSRGVQYHAAAKSALGT